MNLTQEKKVAEIAVIDKQRLNEYINQQNLVLPKAAGGGGST